MRRSVFFAVCLGLVLSLLKEKGTDDGPDGNPPVVPTTEPPGNNTDNETATEPPVVTPTVPSANNTDNETATEPPEVPPTVPSDLVRRSPRVGCERRSVRGRPQNSSRLFQPSRLGSAAMSLVFHFSGNNTDNETATEPPEVTPTEPSGNNTDNETATKPPVVPPTKPSADFCLGDPCGTSLATCVSLHSNYTCVCPYGYYYSSEDCKKGDVYPCSIVVNISYNKNLEIVNSTEYQELYNDVSAFFKEAFKNLSGYVETVIKKIQRLSQSENRNSGPGLNVTVTNLFSDKSDQNESTVSNAIRAAINNTDSFVTSYQEAKHCEFYECDPKTTECEEKRFPECKCKFDLEKTKWSNYSCPVCSANCSAAKHKYCIQEKDGPTCKCMINYKMEAGECVACPVGYSGEECADNSELILIIVGTVFGAIILCLVIAVSVISVRARHKQNPEKRSLIQSGYSDMNIDERPSMFPRVQTTSGHANPGYQPNNPYEMRSRSRDHFPERDYDDLYEISREPTGFRKQSRY
ncbi:mucin-13 [Melospiza georgiana]|uniref:mucin-13 n=1 Tax=Melospiza georgiana TaxID=44398 RepID=UPI0025AB7B20|nr:mucin-13 [Melospiza georgiana]